MSVPYFYEPLLTIGTNRFTLSPETSKHCIQVLRMQEGTNLELTNGVGDIFHASIQTAHKNNTQVTIQSHTFQKECKQKITLGIAILKNAVRLEWLFEKAAELGIHRIVPLITERSIHQRFKMDRMQNIMHSAMIQSQQSWLTRISPPTHFNDFLNANQAAVKLIAHCEPTPKKNIKEMSPNDDLILIIGPEGDFTHVEISKAVQLQYIPIHLGPTRLRTETAAIFALSVLKKLNE